MRVQQGSDKPGKPGKKTEFFVTLRENLENSGNFREIFQIPGNSGNSAEIDFLINLLYFLATIYFKWHYSLFTLYTTVIAGFFYLHIYLV